MTNKEMQSRMEALKILLNGIMKDMETNVVKDSAALLQIASRMKNVDNLFGHESKIFSESIPPADRSNEVLALMGHINLQITEFIQAVGPQLAKDTLRGAMPGTTEQAIKMAHELLRQSGVDVKVINLNDLNDADCNDPDCPVHSNPKAKETHSN